MFYDNMCKFVLFYDNGSKMCGFVIILSTQVSVLEIYCTPIYQANLYTAINLQPLVLP